MLKPIPTGATRKVAVVTIALTLTLIATAAAPSQVFTIRLVDGKSGKPMGNKNVTFDWDTDFKQSVTMVDKDGVGHLEVPQGVRGFMMRPGPRIGDEPNRVPYQNCNERKTAFIPIAQVLEKGVALKNNCGRQWIAPRPGEVVFWGSPLPWWKPDMQ